MDHRDEEISDVVVVVDDSAPCSFKDLVAKLQSLGLAVESVDNDNGVIEGSIASGQVGALKAVPCVKYVRNVFTYVADYPAGDPRNQDNDDGDDESIPR